MSEKLIPMPPPGHERTISSFSDVEAALEQQAYGARDKAALAIYNGENPSVIVAAEREARDADNALLEAYDLQKHLGHVSEVPQIYVKPELHEKPVTDVYVGDIFYNGERDLVVNFSSERIIDGKSYYTVELETQLTDGSVLRDVSILTRVEALALLQSKGVQHIEEGYDRTNKDNAEYADDDVVTEKHQKRSADLTAPAEKDDSVKYDPDDMSTWPAPGGQEIVLASPMVNNQERQPTQNEELRRLTPEEQSQLKPKFKANEIVVFTRDGVSEPGWKISKVIIDEHGLAYNLISPDGYENLAKYVGEECLSPDNTHTEEAAEPEAPSSPGKKSEEVPGIEEWMSRSTKEKVLGVLALSKAKVGVAKNVLKTAGNWLLDRLPDESGSGTMSARHYASDETIIAKKIKSKLPKRTGTKKSGNKPGAAVADRPEPVPEKNPEEPDSTDAKSPNNSAQFNGKSKAESTADPKKSQRNGDVSQEPEDSKNNKGLLPPENLREGRLDYEAAFRTVRQKDPSITHEVWEKYLWNYLTRTGSTETMVFWDVSKQEWVSGAVDINAISDYPDIKSYWLTKDQIKSALSTIEERSPFAP